MAVNSDNKLERLIVHQSIPAYELSVAEDYASVAKVLTASMEAEIVEHLVDRVLDRFETRLAKEADLPSTSAIGMLAIVMKEYPDLWEKYLARCAANRITDVSQG